LLTACTSDDSDMPTNVPQNEPTANPDPTNPEIPGGDTDPMENDVPGADQNEVRTGVFIDSPVSGMSYNTASLSGITNTKGEFSYRAGETITFSIGAMQLPGVGADAIITPVEMGEGALPSQTAVTNIARLLQSLDLDANPSNGIAIPEATALSAVAIDFFVTTEQFENNAAVINMVANSGSLNTTLISAEEANRHLAETLDDLGVPGAN